MENNSQDILRAKALIGDWLSQCMLPISKTLSYYKRSEIAKAMVAAAKNKEIAARYSDKFGKRPDTLEYPNDVLEQAKKGASSFHASEELWTNPLQIKTGMSRKEYDGIRIGWDLVFDIDCKLFEYSKWGAYYIIKALQHKGLKKSISCKFSGNKGFHIGVPFEAFPKELGGVPLKIMFPEAPKKIAEYIKHMIKQPLRDKIFEMEDFNIGNIMKKTGMKYEDLVIHEKNELGDDVAKLNPDPIIELDTLLISSRHMYRLDYSFNEKSGLVSVPVALGKILTFEKKDAEPDMVKVEIPFLDRDVPVEAEALLREALDFVPPEEEKQELRQRTVTSSIKYEDINDDDVIPVECFPAVIQNILKGNMEDGKKRCVFILINFLSSCGWDYDSMDELLHKWNKTHPQPLREVYIKGQLRHYKMNKEKVLPPNYSNKAYYHDLGLLKGETQMKYKNPVNAAKANYRKMPKKKKEKNK